MPPTGHRVSKVERAIVESERKRRKGSVRMRRADCEQSFWLSGARGARPASPQRAKSGVLGPLSLWVCALGALWAGSLVACSSSSSEVTGQESSATPLASVDPLAEAEAVALDAPVVSLPTTSPSQNPPPSPVARPASSGSVSAIEALSIDECDSAGLLPGELDALATGGPLGGGQRLVYPYAETVFPRGLLPPQVMWEGPVADLVYVRIRSAKFEYTGCLAPTGVNQITIPEPVWVAAGERTLGASDPFRIEISPRAEGVVAGPMTVEVKIAQATIRGSIYYNTYSAKGIPGNGQVMRIPAGKAAEPFLDRECNGCHSVSANGARMVSQTLGLGGRAYDLGGSGAGNPPSLPAPNKAAYAALYPDGSHYLTTYATAVVEVARAGLTSSYLTPEALLYNTDSGQLVSSTGIPATGMMPNFSPDGTRLAFSDQSIGNGRALAIMDYDTTTHTASNQRRVHEDPALRIGWPFVLPDNGGVVFTKTNGLDFSGEGAGLFVGLPGPRSDLFVADVDTESTVILARAMGFETPGDAGSDSSYLPYGASELHRNYYPTTSPIAAGGYFWVFFDSVRAYGNLGVHRQLWGAALTISPTGDYTQDPSHPAFYVPGQEFGTGNHRAFAALDPCQEQASECSSGTECCTGFCSDGLCGLPSECSNIAEACEVEEDCCGALPDVRCIAGFCATVTTLR